MQPQTKPEEIKVVSSQTLVVDPVCGMTVNPNGAAGSYEFKGQSYYFCSTHCLKRFRENPERFLNNSTAAKTAQPVGIKSDVAGEG